MRVLPVLVTMVFAGVFAGCFDAAVADAVVTCAGGGCPDGRRCAVALDRCVDNDAETTAPGVVSLDGPVVAAPGDVVSFVLVGDEGWGKDPAARFVAGGFDVDFAVSDVDRDHGTAVIDVAVPDDAVSGAALVFVDLVDAVGNSAVAVLAGSVDVDADAPAVVAGGVRVTIVTPAAALGPVVRAGPASALDVVVPLDEVAVAADVVCDGFVLDVVNSGALLTLHLVRRGEGSLARVGCVVTLDDAVGNRGVTDLDLGPFDDVVPAAAVVDYVRAPKGDRAHADGFADVVVSGAEAGALVVAFDAAPGAVRRLGDARASGDGTVTLALVATDTPTIRVVVVDPAGNVSPETRARARYVASSSGRRGGDPLTNPHRLASLGSDRDELALRDVERDGLDAGAVVVNTAVDFRRRFAHDGGVTAADGFAAWNPAQGEGLLIARCIELDFDPSPRCVAGAFRYDGDGVVEFDPDGVQPPLTQCTGIAYDHSTGETLASCGGALWSTDHRRWQLRGNSAVGGVFVVDDDCAVCDLVDVDFGCFEGDVRVVRGALPVGSVIGQGPRPMAVAAHDGVVDVYVRDAGGFSVARTIDGSFDVVSFHDGAVTLFQTNPPFPEVVRRRVPVDADARVVVDTYVDLDREGQPQLAIGAIVAPLGDGRDVVVGGSDDFEACGDDGCFRGPLFRCPTVVDDGGGARCQLRGTGRFVRGGDGSVLFVGIGGGASVVDDDGLPTGEFIESPPGFLLGTARSRWLASDGNRVFVESAGVWIDDGAVPVPAVVVGDLTAVADLSTGVRAFVYGASFGEGGGVVFVDIDANVFEVEGAVFNGAAAVAVDDVVVTLGGSSDFSVPRDAQTSALSRFSSRGSGSVVALAGSLPTTDLSLARQGDDVVALGHFSSFNGPTLSAVVGDTVIASVFPVDPDLDGGPSDVQNRTGPDRLLASSTALRFVDLAGTHWTARGPQRGSPAVHFDVNLDDVDDEAFAIAAVAVDVDAGCVDARAAACDVVVEFWDGDRWSFVGAGRDAFAAVVDDRVALLRGRVGDQLRVRVRADRGLAPVLTVRALTATLTVVDP